MKFTGPARRRSEYGLQRAAETAGCTPAHILAVLEVEAPRGPFDKIGRPTILFEPHVFYRNLPARLRTAAMAQKLAAPSWGTFPYGTYDEQYGKLSRALLIDEDAALKACSWGSPQILGENHQMIGYATVKAMVTAFMESEDEQINAMAMFIKSKGLGPALARGDWAAFARGYNGSGYAKNGYDKKLASAFSKQEHLASAAVVEGQAPLSQAELRDLQLRLRGLGYFEVGKVDGKMGPSTKAAITAFRSVEGLPPGGLDESVFEALKTANPRPVAPARAEATEAEVVAEVPELKAGVKTRVLSGAQAIGGGVATLAAGIGSNLDTATSALSPLQRVLDNVPVWVWFAIVTVVAGFIWHRAKKTTDKTTEAYQIGARR